MVNDKEEISICLLEPNKTVNCPIRIIRHDAIVEQHIIKGDTSKLFETGAPLQRIVETTNYKCFLRQCCNCHFWSGLRNGNDYGWIKAHCDKKTYLTYREDSCEEFVPTIGENVY
jgi:hypothetical protein